MRSARGDGRHGARRAAQSAQERLQRAMALPTRWARAPRRWPAATWSKPWSATCAATTSGRRRPHPRQRSALRLSASALLNAALSPGWLWRRHSFADMLAAGCPEIDVIRLGAAAARQRGAGTRSADPGPARAPGGGRTRRPPLAGYAWALCYCAIATALSALAFPALHQTNIVMLFLLAVVAVAVRHGRGRRRWLRWSAWACSIFLRAAAGVLRGVGRAVPADLRRAAAVGLLIGHSPPGCACRPRSRSARGRRPQPV